MQLLPNVYLVGGLDLHLTYTDWPSADCNCYVVDSGEGLVMIDCGCGETLGEILENIRACGLVPENVTHLFLTHAHVNHCGATHAFPRNRAKTFAHHTVADAVAAADERTNWMAYHKPFVKCEIDERLEGGEAIEIGDIEIEAVHTPGHTAGCMAYRLTIGNRRIGFTGDVVFADGRTGARRTADYSPEAYVRTLRELAEEPFDVILPGHGVPCMSRGHIWIEDCLTLARSL